jgi:nucleoside-diphosphate-sugar epimerase
MRKFVSVVTGANGEIGRSLVKTLLERGKAVVAVDLSPLAPELTEACEATLTGDILDVNLIERLGAEFACDEIFHLAALLSTRSEFTPETAHRVNVGGTLSLLRLAADQARRDGRPVRFLFPSSIAVYGLPDLATKAAAGAVREDEWNRPITMYGCNKLYCEHLGRYFTENFGQLDAQPRPSGVDFRALRFPGLISAETIPAGGTSDWGPEILHAAAAGQPYACFVAPDARLPFVAMPDAVQALLQLADAEPRSLRQRVYNVGAFSLSAAEIVARASAHFADAKVTYAPQPARAHIVDTWPADVDDEPARRDWGWRPAFDADSAFERYLVPKLRGRYADASGPDRPEARQT